MTLFQARPYGRFTEIQNDLRIKKLHRLNQGSDFLGHSFSEKNIYQNSNLIQKRRSVPVSAMIFLQQILPFLPQQHQNYQISWTKRTDFFSELKSTSHQLAKSSVLSVRLRFEMPTLSVATIQLPDHTYREQRMGCSHHQLQYLLPRRTG